MSVIFIAAGLIFGILGYASRPKPMITIPEARKQVQVTSSPPVPPAEETRETAVSEPALPTPPADETVKPDSKKPKTRTRRKRTRKRRKKA